MKYTHSVKKLAIAAVVIGGVSLVASACSPAAQTTQESTMASTAPMAQQETANADGAMEVQGMNIVETAQANGSFTTLLKAAEVAGLVDELSTLEITVLAPTDAAFAKVPKATLDSLLANPEQLAEVLKYHVILGKVPSTEVVKATAVPTLQGASVNVKVDGQKVMINNANVTMTDVEASNGIIHVIDTVLLPPTE
jgi:transforming growth factor-beta-induced protein